VSHNLVQFLLFLIPRRRGANSLDCFGGDALRLDEALVDAAVGDEFGVGSLFDDFAAGHDYYFVGIFDCAEAMGDADCCAGPGGFVEGLLDYTFRLSVSNRTKKNEGVQQYQVQR
jgi:hypothetical protein